MAPAPGAFARMGVGPSQAREVAPAAPSSTALSCPDPRMASATKTYYWLDGAEGHDLDEEHWRALRDHEQPG
jgi:hypothetical protein